VIAEAVIVLSLWLFVFLTPARAQRLLRLQLRRIGQPIFRLSRPELVLYAGLAAGVLNMTYSLCSFFPQPRIVDEFAYLFGAETFASGQLSNPPHPQAESLRPSVKSGHMIFYPTWQMKYPPGQSLFLAAGILIGNPWIGIQLGIGLAFSAFCWMLLGILPRRWAVCGVLLGLLNWFILRRWGQSFNSGYPAMLGGCLVLGGFFRLLRRPDSRHGAATGVGGVILMLTRPLEGLVLCLPLALALLARILSGSYSTVDRWKLFRCAICPAAPLLAAGFAWQGYYNNAVTRSPFVLPYQEWNRQSDKQPFSELLTNSGQQLTRWIKRQGFVAGSLRFLSNRWAKVQTTLFVFVSPLPAFLLLGWLSLLGSRRALFLAFTEALVWTTVINGGAAWFPPEYLAPVAGLHFLNVTIGWRQLRALKIFRSPATATIPLMMPISLFASFFIHAIRTLPNEALPAFPAQQIEISRQLHATQGRHLVIVKYSQPPDYQSEWVHNHPHTDAQTIVWATDRGDERNRQLMQYYSDRTVWTIRPDEQPAELKKLCAK